MKYLAAAIIAFIVLQLVLGFLRREAKDNRSWNDRNGGAW